MNIILRSNLKNYSLKNRKKHQEHIECVFHTKKRRILDKICSFASRQIKYLRHVIKQGQVKPLKKVII